MLPFTCAPGTNESSLPFCQRSLGFAARAADLAGRLSLQNHVDLFFSYPGSQYVPEYNVKSWSLDHTCIHGVNKASNISVFPHAIAQGASWDLPLIARIGRATAAEARNLSAATYTRTGGQNQGGALSCDGGPLANTAHDPRWGRISECYGEDPVLVEAFGVAALQALQDPRPVAGGKPGDAFLATRQVTRHFIGYHSATPDIHGALTFNATLRTLADSQLPVFGAFQRADGGAADGIMCAMSVLRIEGTNISDASCGSSYLLSEQLRDSWGSDAIVQSDCCDSVRTMNVPFHWHVRRRESNLRRNACVSGALACLAHLRTRKAHVPSDRQLTSLPRQGISSDEEALGVAANAGLQIYYGYDVTGLRQSMANLLGNGTVSEATVRTAGRRVLLSLLRLGFFDAHADDYPFAATAVDWAAHAALAREAAAKSVVLLKNRDGTLPLRPPVRLAVIGPFGECEDQDPKLNGTCYLHSYAGTPDTITTIRAGVAAQSGAPVAYALGCNATCPKGGHDVNASACWDASEPHFAPAAAAALREAEAVAAAAELTVLVVGAGETVEAEGRDRVSLALPPLQQQLAARVARSAARLVVVVVSGGPVDIGDATFDAADAVLWAPYGGEAAGDGVADVLFGRVNPSGRLPSMVYREAWAEAMNAAAETSILNLNLDAGAGRTSRYVRDAAAHVRHTLGFGLSFTAFVFADGSAAVGAGGDLVVRASVTNTGARAGEEVVQAYLSGAALPGTPSASLVGFVKVALPAGAQGTAEVRVPAARLQTANADGTRALVKGQYTVWVGGHHPHDAEGDAALGPCLALSVTL